MLTESEIAWLVQRNPRGKVGDMFFSCHNCDEADKNPRRTKYKTCRYSCKIHKTHKFELQDALEFEGRVAAKLARQSMKYVCEKYPCRYGTPFAGCMRDLTLLTGPYGVHCEDCFLKYARLQVEEEMDNGMDIQAKD